MEKERPSRGEAIESARAALEAADVAAVLSDAGGRVLATTEKARALVGSTALVRTEDELLASLSAVAVEHRTPTEVRDEASKAGCRLQVVDGPSLRVSMRALPGGLTCWVLREERPARRQQQSEILGVASHDMRSPLANIRSYAGLLLSSRSPLDPRLARAAQVISRNADRALRLVDDLFDLQRSDEAQLGLERTEVSVQDLLRHAFEEATISATDRGVKLTWTPPSGLPRMLLDEDRVRRLFRALMETAIRRTPPGGEARLTTECRESEVCISVEDDGPRPDVRQAALAFDRDFQILTHRKLAAGISMALAQVVARAHGGRVGCIPRGTTGAVHYVVLPR